MIFCWLTYLSSSHDCHELKNRITMHSKCNSESFWRIITDNSAEAFLGHSVATLFDNLQQMTYIIAIFQLCHCNWCKIYLLTVHCIHDLNHQKIHLYPVWLCCLTDYFRTLESHRVTMKELSIRLTLWFFTSLHNWTKSMSNKWT